MKDPKDFFKKQKPHSRVKTEIAVEYFQAWAKIMKSRCDFLTYLDLFSGQGYFDDGNRSTPLLILDEIKKLPYLKRILKISFFEEDKELYDRLDTAIKQHPIYNEMYYKPVIKHEQINKDNVKSLPIDDCTFTFIDPYGYKDISEQLLIAVIKNWGSDCLLNLSTSGLIRNIETENQQEQLNDIFSIQGVENIKGGFQKAKSGLCKDRIILDELKCALNKVQKVFFIDFGIELENRPRIYYLVFLSKNKRGFHLMKEIMAKHSHKNTSGIPLYFYNKLLLNEPDQLLLGLDELMPKLTNLLMMDFKGQTLVVKKLYNICHEKNYLFLERNIKEALNILEYEGKIKVDKSRDDRYIGGKLTLGEDRIVTFLKDET